MPLRPRHVVVGICHQSLTWHHGLGAVVTALAQAGLRIEFLNEHPCTLRARWPFCERHPDRTYHLPPAGHRYRCCIRSWRCGPDRGSAAIPRSRSWVRGSPGCAAGSGDNPTRFLAGSPRRRSSGLLARTSPEPGHGPGSSQIHGPARAGSGLPIPAAGPRGTRADHRQPRPRRRRRRPPPGVLPATPASLIT